MEILFVTTELAPFVKVGGLADAGRRHIGSSYNCPLVSTTPSVLSLSTGGMSRLTELQREWNMAWTTPVIEEVCVGMEVTSYLSAEV